VLTAFIEDGDTVFCDERIHASLIDGVRLARGRRVIFPHNDMAALERLLNEETGARQKFVVTESLFSMDGDFAALRQLAELCRAKSAALIVDEAHAVGIYGEKGSGLIEASGTGGDVFLSINTAGKALGVSGAVVAGPAWAIDFLIQRARPFIFSTAPPPSVAAALDASLDVIAAEPERRARLRSHALYLRERLAACGIDTGGGDSQIIPVVLGENERAVSAAEALAQAGFDVRAIRPPTVPRGTARLRISVNVNLSEATLDRFAAALAAALSRIASCSAASS
jgi:8-amino-7-oxononanoate synthase